jgi:hypothetical protein
MCSMLLIKSLDKKLLPGVLALIFLLTMALPGVTLSQENPACEQNVLRQASLKWMQVGMQQYLSNQFSQAEQSFRRALVFQKYLTDAERQQLNKFLADASVAASEGKQAPTIAETADEPIEQAPPVEAAANVEKIEACWPSQEQGRQQIGKELDKAVSQPVLQKAQPVAAATSNVTNIQLAAKSSSDAVVVTNKSSGGKLMQLSTWLSHNRRNILMIGLPILAVLLFISKRQARRKRPGSRVYENPMLETSSFIGVRLNGGRENGRSAAAGNPKRKGFEQLTERWKKQHDIQSPTAAKPFEINEIWPQRKDKFEDDESVVANAEQKLCAKCNQLKPLSEFHKDKSCKDGLSSWCKECKRQSRKNQAAERIE